MFRPAGGTSRLTWRRLTVLLDALPADGLYKTALRDLLDDDQLIELSKRPRTGHGRWTHTDLLLADIIDRLGHLGFGLRVYETQPDPYPRPGVRRGRRKPSPAAKAMLRAIAAEHATLHGYTIDSPADTDGSG